MKVVNIKETFNDFLSPSLLVAVKKCDYKCCKEANIAISTCHNYSLDLEKEIDIKNEYLFNKFINNKFVESLGFAGKEPMLDIYFYDIEKYIEYHRKFDNSPIFIYTGYYENEIIEKINILKKYENIYIKIGRFIPNKQSYKDDLTGVILSNKEQKFIKIS